MKWKRKAVKPTDLVAPNLRMREDLRAAIAQKAKANRVSLNRELNDRIEKSLEAEAVRGLQDIVADLTKALSKVRRQLQAE